MEAGDVVMLLKLLEQEKIGVAVDAGWGTDALLGRQIRPHEDLDIAIEHKDVIKLRKLLEEKGYKELLQPDSSDFNFVLGNALGQKVDVHSYTFDADGKNRLRDSVSSRVLDRNRINRRLCCEVHFS